MKPPVPTIFQLKIERFRGIQSLTWNPAMGVNLILGGGDVGKTTILDAIGLLLNPTNATVVAVTDFYLRDEESEFSIEAIMGLPPETGVDHLVKPAWPWLWDGESAVAPSLDGPVHGQSVYCLRVRGTPDLELVYEIVQPDGTVDPLTVGLRRSIGLVRLGSDDRNDRDLRLIQGSALDRLLSDKGLRSRVAGELAKESIKDKLSATSSDALDNLDKSFGKQRLPTGLDLAFTGGPGLSVTSLVGLTAIRGEIQLPLSSWGAGTRRLAALAITEEHQGDHPIALIDEVERGLEPYRQRLLMNKLQEAESQTFVTTHSATVISAANLAKLWYLDPKNQIGPLEGEKIGLQRDREPETFLARLAIVAEGVTEVGFATALLQRAVGAPLIAYGIHVADGKGHDTAIDLLDALAEGGLHFGGFVDDEGRHSGRWKNLGERLGGLLFRWTSGDLERNLIGAVGDEQLEQLLVDPTGEMTMERLITLAQRLDIPEKTFDAIRAKAGSSLKAIIIEAARGEVPEAKKADKNVYKAHSRKWFKTREGGEELEAKMFQLGLWPTFQERLMVFCNAVRQEMQLEKLADLPHE